MDQHSHGHTQVAQLLSCRGGGKKIPTFSSRYIGQVGTVKKLVKEFIISL